MKALLGFALSVTALASPALAQEVVSGQTSMAGPVEDMRYTELRASVDTLLKQYQTTIQNVMKCQAEKKFWDGTGCVGGAVPINTPIDRPFKLEWKYVSFPQTCSAVTYAGSFCSVNVNLSAYANKPMPKIMGTCFGGWCSFGPYLSTGTKGEISFDFNAPASGTIASNGNGEKTHSLRWTYNPATKVATFRTHYAGGSTASHMRINGIKDLKLGYATVVFTE
jgi:hypothetical protein